MIKKISKSWSLAKVYHREKCHKGSFAKADSRKKISKGLIRESLFRTFSDFLASRKFLPLK